MHVPARAGRFDIADIIRRHRPELERTIRLSASQKRVLTDISQCRTEALGGHVEYCPDCDYEHPVYHSCRNRHCPKCQALAQETWIAEQRVRLLDVPHFHVVFTLPSELRALAKFAPRAVLGALHHASARTLLEMGDRQLDATIGATLVLHTWTRKLEFHPHIHAIVTAGGLSRNGQAFPRRGRSFLFPVRALSRLFRGKLLAELNRLEREGEFARFDDFADPEAFVRLMAKLAKLAFHVYCKPTFERGEHVLQYLGRYTHRVGISHSRLLHVDENHVTFRTKGDGTETVTPVEFLKRFVQHVLPDGFHKIRHVGLYASPKKHATAMDLLSRRAPPERRKPDWRERLQELLGRDGCCPRCGAMLRVRVVPVARAPPLAA